MDFCNEITRIEKEKEGWRRDGGRMEGRMERGKERKVNRKVEEWEGGRE